MQELEKLGKIMSVVMDNCDDCPLEKSMHFGQMPC